MTLSINQLHDHIIMICLLYLLICTHMILWASTISGSQTLLSANCNIESNSDRNIRLCKPCICDLNGSETIDCDKLTRRCLCKTGFSGPRCNKCSLGYFQSSSVIVRNSTTSTSCSRCGDCFDSWHSKIGQLEELSTDSVNRAYLASSKLSIQEFHSINLTVSKFDHESNGNSLEDLNKIFDKIGNQIQDNKRHTDQLKIITEDIGNINSTMNVFENEFNKIQTILDDLTSRAQILIESSLVHNQSLNFIGDRLNKFKQEEEALVGQSTLGAYKMIKKHGQRSQLASLTATRDNIYFKLELDKFMKDFEPELIKIRYSVRQMDQIGSRILKNLSQPNLDFSYDSFNLTQNSARLMTNLVCKQVGEYSGSSNNSDRNSRQSISFEVQDISLSIRNSFSKLIKFRNRLTTLRQTIPTRNDIARLSENLHMSKNWFISLSSGIDEIMQEFYNKRPMIEAQMLIWPTAINQSTALIQAHVIALRELVDEKNVAEVKEFKSRVVGLRDLGQSLLIKRKNITNILIDTSTTNDKVKSIILSTKMDAVIVIESIKNITLMLHDICKFIV